MPLVLAAAAARSRATTRLSAEKPCRIGRDEVAAVLLSTGAEFVRAGGIRRGRALAAAGGGAHAYLPGLSVCSAAKRSAPHDSGRQLVEAHDPRAQCALRGVPAPRLPRPRTNETNATLRTRCLPPAPTPGWARAARDGKAHRATADCREGTRGRWRRDARRRGRAPKGPTTGYSQKRCDRTRGAARRGAPCPRSIGPRRARASGAAGTSPAATCGTPPARARPARAAHAPAPIAAGAGATPRSKVTTAAARRAPPRRCAMLRGRFGARERPAPHARSETLLHCTALHSARRRNARHGGARNICSVRRAALPRRARAAGTSARRGTARIGRRHNARRSVGAAL